MEKVKNAYSEIISVLKKHQDLCVFDVQELERKSNVHLFGLELKEVYGLNIDPKQADSLDFFRQGEYGYIAKYGEEHRRTIAWPVDGRQPENEMLYQISFSTGAYIFGDGGLFDKDYPVEFFKKFWLELKSFNPDYVDDVNHGLYWKIENAKDIFNSFNSILEKYHALNREDIKQRRIEKMKKDLEQLQKS